MSSQVRLFVIPFVILIFLSFWASAQPGNAPFVNPFIGTGGHGHTYPGATAPFGMVQLSPDTRLGGWDGCSGYHNSDSLLYGFSHTHLSGTGVEDYCDVLFLPFTGEVELNNNTYASPFSKQKEKAEAGYYSVFLEKYGIQAELTATERVGLHRYTFPPNRPTGRILIDLRHRDEVLASALKVVGDREVEGRRVSKSWAKEQHLFFVARFSRPFFNAYSLDMSVSPNVSNRSTESKAIVGILDFYTENQPIVVTVGISGTSIEGARKNLDAECAHFDFNRIKTETQAKWAAQLAKIEVKGGSLAQKTAFYSALYHTMVVPNVWSDADGRYRGRDGALHILPQGENQYSVFSLWDTYRACNPLYTILEPQRTRDFVGTFLRQYDEGGLLPVWELSANETDCMIGNHAIPVVADAYLKGIRGFDAEKALKAMCKSAEQERYGLRWYRELGYVPAGKEAESVSKTLEYAYDDWCIAQMARAMGRLDVYEAYARRAQSYKNVFDPESGFFRAKNNAAWHRPFDPFEVNFNYTEANAWQYRFATPQDVGGLMRLLGGKTAFAAQLDSLFSARAHTTGRDQADLTGLIGQYVQGNEPSHHMAYLYNYAGQPWKTQQRVRQIMDELYGSHPEGLSGNEDCGQMSAWLIFSALGFYPVNPASGEYVIGTPWFEEAAIRLANGKIFRVSAPGVSAKNCYIRSARLNGKPWTKSWFPHDSLAAGGELIFEMADGPANWGAAEADCPVSAVEGPEIVPVPFVKKGERSFKNAQSIELACIDPEAVIFYKIEDTKGEWRPYKQPVTLEKSAVLLISARKNGQNSLVDRAEFSKMPAGVSVRRYNTAYNAQYTAHGDEGLIDGMRGGADFRTGGWQGFEGVDLDVVFDLGARRAIRSVRAGFLQDENAWIFYPVKMRVEISDDGEHFTPLGEIQNSTPILEKGLIIKDFSLTVKKKKTRYVRVVGQNLGKCPPEHKGAGFPCWVFADEVQIE
jgi:predicted alpha-1,2-mannosidase